MSTLLLIDDLRFSILDIMDMTSENWRKLLTGLFMLNATVLIMLQYVQYNEVKHDEWKTHLFRLLDKLYDGTLECAKHRLLPS
jgi:hypothetical protein